MAPTLLCHLFLPSTNLLLYIHIWKIIYACRDGSLSFIVPKFHIFVQPTECCLWASILETGLEPKWTAGNSHEGVNRQDFGLEFLTYSLAITCQRGKGITSVNRGPLPTWLQACYKESSSYSDIKEPKTQPATHFIVFWRFLIYFFLLFSPLSCSHNPWLQ